MKKWNYNEVVKFVLIDENDYAKFFVESTINFQGTEEEFQDWFRDTLLNAPNLLNKLSVEGSSKYTVDATYLDDFMGDDIKCISQRIFDVEIEFNDRGEFDNMSVTYDPLGLRGGLEIVNGGNMEKSNQWVEMNRGYVEEKLKENNFVELVVFLAKASENDIQALVSDMVGNDSGIGTSISQCINVLIREKDSILNIQKSEINKSSELVNGYHKSHFELNWEATNKHTMDSVVEGILVDMKDRDKEELIEVVKENIDNSFVYSADALIFACNNNLLDHKDMINIEVFNEVLEEIVLERVNENLEVQDENLSM